MVAAELLAGARDKREQGLIESFLLPFQIISPTEADGLAEKSAESDDGRNLPVAGKCPLFSPFVHQTPQPDTWR